MEKTGRSSVDRLFFSSIKDRNIIVIYLTLVLGIGISAIGGISINIEEVSIVLTGLFIATVVGVLANLVLPKQEERSEFDIEPDKENTNE